jgi:hypothetical protein
MAMGPERPDRTVPSRRAQPRASPTREQNDLNNDKRKANSIGFPMAGLVESAGDVGENNQTRMQET